MAIALLEQLRVARQHPNVAAFGAALGGFPPATAYLLTHQALPQLWGKPGALDRTLLYALLPVVAACLVFSVRTVWQWGAQAFHERLKAGCLVVALEGAMVLSPIPALSAVALAYLILINAVATACTLVAEDKPAPARPLSHELNAPRKPARVQARPVPT